MGLFLFPFLSPEDFEDDEEKPEGTDDDGLNNKKEVPCGILLDE